MSAADVYVGDNSLAPLHLEASSKGIRSKHLQGCRSEHSIEEYVMLSIRIPDPPSISTCGTMSSNARHLNVYRGLRHVIESLTLGIQSCNGFVVVKKQKPGFDAFFVKDHGVLGYGNIINIIAPLSHLRRVYAQFQTGKTIQFRIKGVLPSDVGFVEDEFVIRIFNRIHQKLLAVDKENSAKEENKGSKITEEAPDSDSDSEPTISDVPKASASKHLLERKFLLEAIDDHSRNVEPVPLIKDPFFYKILKDLINSAFAGLDKGYPPVQTDEGSGGVYFLPNVSGDSYVGVFKPSDEEPLAPNNPNGLSNMPITNGQGLKRGTRVGEGAMREVAAYILDHPIRSFSKEQGGFAGVPPTVMIGCLHERFNHNGGFENSPKNMKIGSLQKFVRRYGSCEDMGYGLFSVSEVHKISVLDIRLANTDRHGGNILVCKGEAEKHNFVLVPIDHGYCLPENFEDCTFEWMYWPQARQPYNNDTIDYIDSLDAEFDIALLKSHGWELSVECARVFRLSTMLLKKGARMGLTPFTIGSLMCRDPVFDNKSTIEEMVEEANSIADSIGLNPDCSHETEFMETVSHIMDRRLDEVIDG